MSANTLFLRLLAGLLALWVVPMSVQAGFLGQTVSVDYRYPTVTTNYAAAGGPVSAVVGQSVEFRLFAGNPTVDVSERNILITYPAGFNLDPGPNSFDGLVITSVSSSIPNIVGATLAATNISGTAGITFDARHVYINQEGLSNTFAPGSFISVNVQFGAGPTPSSTTLVSNANPSVHGQAVTYSTTVAGNAGTPTGSVMFRDGGSVLCGDVLLVAGKAQCTSAPPTVGTHSITATYSGDATYASSTGPLSQLVTDIASSPQYTGIAAGYDTSYLLRTDGTLWSWGYNSDGQLGDGTTFNRSSPVRVLGAVKSVAAGGLHALALKADGTVWAWGSNRYGQLGDNTIVGRTSPVQIMTGVLAIAAGYDHSLALKTDGTLWAWGGNGAGQLGDGSKFSRAAPVLVMSGVQSIAAGAGHSLALKADNSLWAWGWNGYGQLGNGTTTDLLVPAQVLSGVQAVAGGGGHTLATRTDGSLWAWGQNNYGQLGLGAGPDRSTPAQVLTGVRSLAAGGWHSLAIRSDGTLWAWGRNYYGQLGNGTYIDRNTPQSVLGAVQTVTAGTGHTLAIKNDGTLWAWGENFFGEIGDGTTIVRAAPVSVLNGAKAVGAGGFHSMALKTDATLWAWGDNYYGQVGDGTTVNRATPVQVLSGVQSAASGHDHSLAILSNGSLMAWGLNSSGQLGDGTQSNGASPAQIMTAAKAVAAGRAHSLALKVDGTLMAWGANASGQLGDGSRANRPVPAAVSSGMAAIAAGSYFSLALKADGTVWAWGQNSSGQLGDGTTTDRLTAVQIMTGVRAIAAGAVHALALKVDGTVWAWGHNDQGQIGDGTTVRRATPVLVSNDVQAIAAGANHSLAIKSDGTLWSWGAVANPGSSVQRVPQQNPYLRNIVGIAAGDTHSLALTIGGKVMAWGGNYVEELAIPHAFYVTSPVAVRDPLATYAGADLVVEFFNPSIKNGAGTAGIGHYFITAAPDEAASIDVGGSGPGWARTGRTFRAWNERAKAPANAVGVCRFYAGGPNSHFYTADSAECQSLKDQNPANNPNVGWSYEGIAFYTIVPAASGGQCPSGFHPVFRSYNNRFHPSPALNDSNHRITPSFNDHQRSIRFFGYVDELIAFCSPISGNPGGDLQVTYVYPGSTVQSGAPITAEFLFGNNGAGNGDGGSVFIALPAEVANWNIACQARNGAVCPSTSDPTQLREGQSIASWPAGGTLAFTASGIAPQVGTGSESVLRFAATVANASGSPDSTPANDTPPLSQTVVKALAVCNTVPNPGVLQLGTGAQQPHANLIIGSGCNWGAQSNVPWLSASPSSGTGDAILTLSAAANTTTAQRTGVVTINDKSIVVTQAGIPCTFVANPATLTFPSAGQGTVVAIAAPSGCDWSAQSSDSTWLAVDPASGSGAGSITIAAQPNAATSGRSGSIAVGDLSIPAVQSGMSEPTPAPPPPPANPCETLRVQREGDQVPAEGFTGAQSIDVIADARCAWEARSNDRWITLSAGGSGKGNGIVNYNVDPHFDFPVRNGSLTIGTKTFTINQSGYRSSEPGSDGGSDGSSGSGSSGGASGGGAG